MKQWKSIAKWDSCHGFYNNETTDEHETKEQAESVCRLLERDGLGGERIHFPISTRVEELPSHVGIVSDRPAICTCGLHEVSGGNIVCDWCIAQKENDIDIKEMKRLLTKDTLL